MQKNDIKTFIECLYEGIAAWEKAGKILVAMLKHNPNIKEQIVRDHPEISLGTLARLEAVGRGQLKPELLLSDAAPYKAARSLPISDQQRLLETGRVPLLIETDRGPDVIHADFKTLTPKQVHQVFAEDHIRSEAEQRTFIESRRKKIARDWDFENGMVVFKRGAKLTIQQLSGIIQEIAGHKRVA